MPKFKVEFSNYATTLPEHGLDFPNVEASCKGAREIASKLPADSICMSGSNFSDWHMTIMNADGTTVTDLARKLAPSQLPQRHRSGARHFRTVATVFENAIQRP
jgi:hypothetical protein